MAQTLFPAVSTYDPLLACFRIRPIKLNHFAVIWIFAPRTDCFCEIRVPLLSSNAFHFHGEIACSAHEPSLSVCGHPNQQLLRAKVPACHA
jgi:hypothetical protein